MLVNFSALENVLPHKNLEHHEPSFFAPFPAYSWHCLLPHNSLITRNWILPGILGATLTLFFACLPNYFVRPKYGAPTAWVWCHRQARACHCEENVNSMLRGTQWKNIFFLRVSRKNMSYIGCVSSYLQPVASRMRDQAPWQSPFLSHMYFSRSTQALNDCIGPAHDS